MFQTWLPSLGRETTAEKVFLVLSSCGNGQLLKLFPPSWNNGKLVFNLFPTGIIMNDRHDLAKLGGNLFDHIEFDNAELCTEIQYRSSCEQAFFRLFVELEQQLVDSDYPILVKSGSK